MHKHLQLLAQVTDIAPILALRSLSPFEPAVFEAFDRAPALQVAILDGHATLLIAGAPAITSQVAQGRIALEAVAQLPDDLQALTAALGMRPGGSAPLCLDEEQFHDRLLTLDAAWVMLHRLGRPSIQRETVDQVVDLIALALGWSRNQADLCNKGETRQYETTREALAQHGRHLVASLPGVVSLTLQDDPRGAALVLDFADGQDLRVSPLVFNWNVGEPTHPPTRRKARQPAAAGSFHVKPTKVSSQVLEALQGALCSGREVRLPGKLAKRVYDGANEVLTALGGVWQTGVQAHVFPEEAKPLLREVIASSVFYRRQDFEYFHTPRALAERVVRLANLRPGMLVGEFSAGQGALALLAADIVGKNNVLVYELMPQNVKVLQGLGFTIDGPTDFLAMQPQRLVDAVCLNPPFSGGRDMAHIQHALRWLKPGGKLVAIASTTWQRQGSRDAVAFRSLLDELDARIEQIPAGTFSEAGTQVPTVLIELRIAAQREQDVAPVAYVPPAATPPPQQLSFF